MDELLQSFFIVASHLRDMQMYIIAMQEGALGQQSAFFLPNVWPKTLLYNLADSQQKLENFLFATMSRLALGPTQPPNQWVQG
jgi:hypothetical protein